MKIHYRFFLTLLFSFICTVLFTILSVVLGRLMTPVDTYSIELYLILLFVGGLYGQVFGSSIGAYVFADQKEKKGIHLGYTVVMAIIASVILSVLMYLFPASTAVVALLFLLPSVLTTVGSQFFTKFHQ